MSQAPSGFPEPLTSERNAPTTGRERLILIAAAVILLGLIVGIAFAISAMLGNPQQTETVRDIFIIFMAVETLVIGLALIVLILQIARLTNLLQNEIRPILESTQETVSTLRGTTRFLSDNLVEPVVKANSTMAALRRAMDLIRGGRRR
jgi:hypothetical protein